MKVVFAIVTAYFAWYLIFFVGMLGLNNFDLLPSYLKMSWTGGLEKPALMNAFAIVATIVSMGIWFLAARFIREGRPKA